MLYIWYNQNICLMLLFCIKHIQAHLLRQKGGTPHGQKEIIHTKPPVERIAYRFYGVPTANDAALEAKTFGCCRYLWNRMLGDRNTLYQEIGEAPDNTPADYKDLDECNWLKEAGLPSHLPMSSSTLKQHSAVSSRVHPGIRNSNQKRSVGNRIPQTLFVLRTEIQHCPG